MNNRPTPKALGSQFDAFLFAPLGRDRNEMVLSVVSALARLDLDPWQVAADLARVSSGVAASRLGTLIAGLPGGPPSSFDSGPSTARLVALLPARHSIPSPLPPITLPAKAAPNYHLIVSLVVSALFMFGAQYIIASHQASLPADDAVGAVTKPVAAALPTGFAP